MMMKLNIKDLYPIQTQLDDRIFKTHGTSRLATHRDRMLALLVELAELANETRCFKFWSLKPASASDVIGQEYVDGIHFLLSLGIDLGSPFDVIEQKQVEYEHLTDYFIAFVQAIMTLKDDFTKHQYQHAFSLYLALGAKLGFDAQTITEHYLMKNKMNHQRQDEQY
jgi:dimeric dUTPase (all-alpha-NTP-PPase superfamily)